MKCQNSPNLEKIAWRFNLFPDNQNFIKKLSKLTFNKNNLINNNNTFQEQWLKINKNNIEMWLSCYKI